MGRDGHKRQPIMRMKRRKWLATSYETISYGLEHYGHGEWKNFFLDYFQSSTKNTQRSIRTYNTKCSIIMCKSTLRNALRHINIVILLLMNIHVHIHYVSNQIHI